MQVLKMLHKMHTGIAIILLCGLFTQSIVSKSYADLDEASRKEISERIAPVSKACEIGQPCAENVDVAVAASDEPRSGEKIYDQHCVTCHKIGLLGSPKKGDKAVWEQRLKELGSFGKLLANAINGIGAMPPKGTCMDCSDDELQKAIEYMSGLKP